jgi:Asp-tRNA(Asn)/Glu-tRNA(Gln) amidotransferase A subunit family amidase
MTQATSSIRKRSTESDGELCALSACDAVVAIRERRLSATALLDACLARIDARGPVIHAWSHLARQAARERAQFADESLAAGIVLGPLHGLPIGVKDVFDTDDMPSEYGSGLHRGRRPEADAVAVAVLRRAGAIIIGKTTTSEFGMYHPSPARNPHDPMYSPGVSSAGSAAAVVDEMVPLALGTQHTASTILPASFCGAHAFKPSFGFTSMEGSNILVPRLAHIGFLARSVEDLCLFASPFDPTLATARIYVMRPPRFAFVRGPGWEQVTPDADEALRNLLASLPVAVDELELPGDFDDAVKVSFGLLNAHLAHRFGDLPPQSFADLCPPLRAGVAAGKILSAPDYLELNAAADRMTAAASSLFEHYDALVTLSAPGEATRMEDGPGSGVLAVPWSLCGLPTASLPLLHGATGLPIGVQLIGQQGCDRKLLQSAAWLARTCQNHSLERA